MVKIRPNGMKFVGSVINKLAHPYDEVDLAGEMPEGWSAYRILALRADIPNANGDCFPLSELGSVANEMNGKPVYAYQTFIGQHFRVNHDQVSDKAVRGKIFDAILVEHPQGAYPQTCGPLCKAHVECLVGVDGSSFPDLIASIDKGNLDVSMGCVCDSASCSICGNTIANDFEQPCEHIRNYKGSSYQGKPVYEIIHRPAFVELSKVDDGADPAAVILERVASSKPDGLGDRITGLFKVVARRLGLSVEELEREAQLERKPSATFLALRERRQAERYRQLIAEEYDYSSTQFDLPKDIADVVLAFAKSIPAEDLAEDGIEDNPHITVKYGIKGDQDKAIETLKDLLADQPPIKVTFGASSLFENDDADVLKYDVKSHDLHDLNSKIAEALDTDDTQDEYVPHVTVAYLKPGKGANWKGNNDLADKEATLDKLTFSGKDGETEEIKLTGKEADSKEAWRKIAVKRMATTIRDLGAGYKAGADIGTVSSEKGRQDYRIVVYRESANDYLVHLEGAMGEHVLSDVFSADASLSDVISAVQEYCNSNAPGWFDIHLDSRYANRKRKAALDLPALADQVAQQYGLTGKDIDMAARDSAEPIINERLKPAGDYRLTDNGYVDTGVDDIDLEADLDNLVGKDYADYDDAVGAVLEAMNNAFKAEYVKQLKEMARQLVEEGELTGTPASRKPSATLIALRASRRRARERSN